MVGDGRRLPIRRHVSRREAVVVRQRVHAFDDAQQLHKAAAAVRTATTAQTGRSGFELGTQVSTTLQRLDDGVGRGRGGNCAVLGGGALLGLGHVFVKPDALCRCNSQQAAVFHQEFNAGIAHGAHGFAFLQDVADLELAAGTLGIDCKDGASACDSSDSSELGHDDLR